VETDLVEEVSEVVLEVVLLEMEDLLEEVTEEVVVLDTRNCTEKSYFSK
jgi:hypothetical protein